MRVFDSTVRHWRPCGRLRHGGQRLPRYGEKKLFIMHNNRLFYLWYRGGKGARLIGIRANSPPHYPYLEKWDTEWYPVAIKKRKVSDGPVLQAALDGTSVMFKKYPLLVEFITATAYEDGSPRRPGYFQVRNCVIEFQLILSDPDAGMRFTIRSRELDKLFLGAEAILGAEDAPWEVDTWLMNKLPKKSGKKK